MSNKYIYVFVRLDLPFAQIAVQTSHVILEATRYFVKKKDRHPTFIFLQVKNEKELDGVIEWASFARLNFTTFKEPDRNHEMTALATGLISENQRFWFAHYKLLTFKSWLWNNIKRKIGL